MKIDKKPPRSAAKRLWHIIRVLYYMLRKSVSKHKLMIGLNLHLLLERSKIAGKAIGNLLSAFHHHHHHHHDHGESFSVYREIEFSCSNTPFQAVKRKGKRHCGYESHDHVSAIAEAFEILNSEALADDNLNAMMSSPTPRARQLRGEEEEEEEEEGGSQVDREAEEFIRRFYEQLRLQQQRVGAVN